MDGPGHEPDRDITMANSWLGATSSWDQAIEVVTRAGVKEPALIHHDPEHDDQILTAVEKECQREFSDCLMAREGRCPGREATRF